MCIRDRATSDGSDVDGIDVEKGGACTRFNMRLELKVHSKNCKYHVRYKVVTANSKNCHPRTDQPWINVHLKNFLLGSS